MPNRLARDSALLRDTVRAAGDFARSKFRTDYRSWTKGGSSPVSEVDIATDRLIHDRLMQATPDYGWLSEESADDLARLDKAYTWIVDPIDGTRGFIAGKEDWCVSVALVADGRPVLAAVYAPVMEEMFFASHGQGATRNGAPIACSPGKDLVFPRIAGPKPLVERFADDGEDVRIYPKISSLALRLCFVADGRLDAGLAGGMSRDWDLAAADLIVHQANGKMTSLSGNSIYYNRKDVTHGLLVAAGAERHGFLVDDYRHRAWT